MTRARNADCCSWRRRDSAITRSIAISTGVLTRRWGIGTSVRLRVETVTSIFAVGIFRHPLRSPALTGAGASLYTALQAVVKPRSTSRIHCGGHPAACERCGSYSWRRGCGRCKASCRRQSSSFLHGHCTCLSSSCQGRVLLCFLPVGVTVPRNPVQERTPQPLDEAALSRITPP